jgi:hypothetical protein
MMTTAAIQSTGLAVVPAIERAKTRANVRNTNGKCIPAGLERFRKHQAGAAIFASMCTRALFSH